MRLDWLEGEGSVALCPVCGTEGRKTAILRTDHLLAPGESITLLRCGECGAAFLDDLTIPDYERELAEVLDYYVEQGAGIDLIVAPLRRIPSHPSARCLEIGCSFGYALDFARHSFGWDVLGVDPSPLAQYGETALGVPIIRAYFNETLDVGPEPFDLVLCSEILEHVAEPYALLDGIRKRLAPEGMLVLSTPNVGIVRRETDTGMLARALSAGLHLILYDPSSLERLLKQAGFQDVLIEESPETLRAFASSSVGVTSRLLPADPAAERTLLRNYLNVRKQQVPSASTLASGFSYRHFKECVNAGMYQEAVLSRSHLATVYRERYAIDLDDLTTLRSASSHPFNLTGTLFFCGILELNGLGRPDRAASCFAAAIEAYDILGKSACAFALYDGETEALMRQSYKHLPMALAATDPERAVHAVESLHSLDADRLPAALIRESMNQTFVRLVNHGAYAAASRLAPAVAGEVNSQPIENAEETVGALDPLYCLGMLALQLGRPKEAAGLFGRVRALAQAAKTEQWKCMFETAQKHEALSRSLISGVKSADGEPGRSDS